MIKYIFMIVFLLFGTSANAQWLGVHIGIPGNSHLPGTNGGGGGPVIPNNAMTFNGAYMLFKGQYMTFTHS